MSNRSYLCGARQLRIQPSRVEEGFDAETQVLVNDVIGVPALWFLLFRSADIQQETFETEDGDFALEAPIASTSAALTCLERNSIAMARAFEPFGSIAPHIELFKQAIATSPWPFITIELEEIAYTDDPVNFFAAVRAVLDKLERGEHEGVFEMFEGISAFEEFTLPPVRFGLDALDDTSGNDEWNFTRVLGAGKYVSGIGCPVPWEPSEE